MTAALLGIVLWELTVARPFMVPVCLSALLAFLMNPLVRFLCRHRVPQGISVTLSACLLVLPLLFVVSFLAYEIRALINELPSIITGFNQKLTQLSGSSLFLRFHLPLTMRETLERMTSGADHGIPSLLRGLEGVLKMGSEFILILIFSIVMLASRNHLRTSTERILKRVEGIQSSKMLDEVTVLIEKFLIARLIIVAIVAAASMLVLRLFGVNYSFILGLFVGIMTLLPNIGFLVSLVPVLVVTLATGHSVLSTALLVGALLIIAALEGYVLTPKLLGRRLNINTLSTFLGVFAGGLLWGVAGMFLGVLILGVLRITLSAAPTSEAWGNLLAQPKPDRKT